MLTEEDKIKQEEEVSDKILTIPNIISFARLCLVFVFFFVLISGDNLLACALFAIAALTDCIDGQVARRTHSVSKLGQLLDPAVDRVLMIAGVVGLLIIGWLPLWIPLVVIIRDLLLLIGGAYLLKRHGIRIAVIYPGKAATTFLFIGFAWLLLHMPMLAGLGLCSFDWLPVFNCEPYCFGFWSIYIGLALGVGTTIYYIAASIKALKAKLRAEKA